MSRCILSGAARDSARFKRTLRERASWFEISRDLPHRSAGPAQERAKASSVAAAKGRLVLHAALQAAE